MMLRKNALGALRNIANIVSESHVAKQNILQRVVKALNVSTEDIREQAALLIWDLACDPVSKATIQASHDIITPLVRLLGVEHHGCRDAAVGALTMFLWYGESSIRSNTVTLICSTIHSSNQKIIMMKAIIPIVLPLLADKEVVIRACGATTINQFALEEGSRDIFMSFPALDMLIALLVDSSYTVLLHACTAIQTLMSDEHPYIQWNECGIMKVSKLLQSKYSTICKISSQILLRLVEKQSIPVSMLTAFATDVFSCLKNTDTVVQSNVDIRLKQQPTEVSLNIAEIIRHLARYEVSHDAIVNAGAIKLIIRLASTTADLGTSIAATGAIANLALHKKFTEIQEMIDGGVVIILHKCLQDSKNISLRKNAVGALRNIANCAGFEPYVAIDDVIFSLINLLQDTEAVLREQAALTIWSISCAKLIKPSVAILELLLYVIVQDTEQEREAARGALKEFLCYGDSGSKIQTINIIESHVLKSVHRNKMSIEATNLLILIFNDVDIKVRIAAYSLYLTLFPFIVSDSQDH